jgi:hypothetical protein
MTPDTADVVARLLDAAVLAAQQSLADARVEASAAAHQHALRAATVRDLELRLRFLLAAQQEVRR